jgi:hypothetical protein
MAMLNLQSRGITEEQIISLILCEETATVEG